MSEPPDLDQYPGIYEDEDYLITYEPALDEEGPGGNVPVCYMASAELSEHGEAESQMWLLIDPDQPERAEHWFELLHRLAQTLGDRGIFLPPES